MRYNFKLKDPPKIEMVKLKIFVGNFPRETTMKELYKFFQGLAQERIRICNPLKRSKVKKPNNKPYCILIVSNQSDYEHILSKQHYWMDETVHIKVAPYERKAVSTPKGREDRFGGENNHSRHISDYFAKPGANLERPYPGYTSNGFLEERNRVTSHSNYKGGSFKSGLEKYGIVTQSKKVFASGIPRGWDCQDLNKRMISFGKVENIVIIDKYGLDKTGFEHLTSLDEEAIP